MIDVDVSHGNEIVSLVYSPAFLSIGIEWTEYGMKQQLEMNL